MVCRVFQKSGGAKKYPSSHHHHARVPTGVVNLVNHPYNLEIGSAPTIVGMGMGPPINMPHHQIQYHHHHVGLGDPNSSHFLNLYGRNYTNTNNNMSPTAELAEIARVFRANNNGVITTTSTTSPSSTTLPMQHLNYPPPAAAFTISGLNLNLGSAGAGATAQPLFRPMNPHDVGSNMMTAGTSLSGAENVGYGNSTAEMSNPNPNPNIAPNNNRYMGMDHCVDLENYWPSY